MKTLPHVKDFLSGVLDNISQGVLFIDLQGSITSCNKAAESILGIPADAILTKKFWEVFPDGTFGFSIEESLQQNIDHTTYSTYTSPDNTTLDLEVATTLIPSQGMILILKDVTEIRHLQAILNRANKMKELGEMAAHVAHEIRNPLGGIKGFASLLKRDLADNPQLEKMADYIVKGTDNLNELVDQILHYSRPLHLHIETTDLITLLNDIKTLLLADAQFKDKEISLKLSSPSGTLPIAIDAHIIKSAILNLLVNAAEAVAKKGKITIKVDKTPKYASISIADNGIGIPQEHLSKLYSPFFTTKPEGNGLGLAEVQKVVQAHGGTIDVESKVGHGTTFTLKLPLHIKPKG